MKQKMKWIYNYKITKKENKMKYENSQERNEWINEIPARNEMK